MELDGKAAMVLSFDIDEEAIAEHDEWHSHEHLQERLSIPGFLRGSRWISTNSEPRYFVLYEVEDLDILASKPYLDRLNTPSAWTTKMMSHYRGMKRGLCRLISGSGQGLGAHALVLRFNPRERKETALREWLTQESLPSLVSKRGIVSTRLYESALSAEMTEEQRIRGKDRGVGWVLWVMGYDSDIIATLTDTALSFRELGERGAMDQVQGTYQLAHFLTTQVSSNG